jgi:hypothetical protein
MSLWKEHSKDVQTIVEMTHNIRFWNPLGFSGGIGLGTGSVLLLKASKLILFGANLNELI